MRADELKETDQVRLLDQAVDFGMASWALPVSTDPVTYQRRSSRRYAVNLPEKWDERLAHYLGWLVGDGSLSDDKAATVYGTETEQQTAMLLHRELLDRDERRDRPKALRPSERHDAASYHSRCSGELPQGLGSSTRPIARKACAVGDLRGPQADRCGVPSRLV